MFYFHVYYSLVTYNACFGASKGQVDEAVACYKKAIELAPTYAEAHCNLGRALQRQGRFAAGACKERGAGGSQLARLASGRG